MTPNDATHMMPGALDGIVVLDLTRVLAGPYCTMTLGDLGATVWKIENPTGGDETRAWQPPAVAGEATYYLSVNANKKSVALDLKSEAGAQIARDLARKADVLVANFLPGTLERFGLDYATVSATNPKIVHCAISGYGATGSRSQHAGYDFVIQGESGLMSITGEPEGEPIKYGIATSDIMAGSNAVQAILAALVARARTGRGQSIDISLLDSAIAALANVASGALNANSGMERFGNAHASIVPYQTFKTRDGAIVLACGNDRQFGDLCRDVIGRPELVDDERFCSNSQRVINRTLLVAILQSDFGAMSTEALLARTRAVNVPAGEIRYLPAALEAPEVLERGMVVTVDHPRAGRLRLTASPLHLSDTPPRPRSAPPLLGEHTREVLGEVLGFDSQRLESLEAAGIVKSLLAAAPG